MSAPCRTESPHRLHLQITGPASGVLHMVTASQQDPPSAFAWGTANFEGGGLAARGCAERAVASRQLDCNGDDEWELNISERARVVFYGSVVHL